MRHNLESLAAFMVCLWQSWNGEVAYQRYLSHWRLQHTSEGQPLSRKAFFAGETQRKWSGIKRCC